MPDFVVEFGAGKEPPADGRLHGPAFARNHAPIWSVIEPFLAGRTGDVLEVGSGTGEHVVDYARRAPAVTWWPTDIHPRHLASIAAWRAHAQLSNIQSPARVDLLRDDWDAELAAPSAFMAIICINVLHISPWRVSESLLAAAARRLTDDGRVFIYGPFMRDGAHTAPSNAAFDATLKAENPDWGVRDVRDLAALAQAAGLTLVNIAPMPANNLVLAFGRAERST